MALIAPIIYLFGALFTGLNGAHGNSPFDSDEQILLRTDYLQIKGFNRTFFPLRTGISIDIVDDTFHVYGQYNSDGQTIFSLSGNFIGYSNFIYQYSPISGGTNAQRLRQDEVGFLSNDGNLHQVFVGNLNSVYFYLDSSHYGLSFDFSFQLKVFNILDSSFAFADLNNDYFAPFVVDDGIKEYSQPVYGVPDGSQYYFSQFFARDNFVAKIGEDAISDTPHGFAPFGSLFRWLDLNVLNIGETQVGLMAYGYLYWCAHVLVFDLVFMCATFFITFVDSCFTKFNRSE